MASIIVRGLDRSVKKLLAARAKAHGRSLSAEVRFILNRAGQPKHIGIALLNAARVADAAIDLRIPDRTDTARAATLD